MKANELRLGNYILDVFDLKNTVIRKIDLEDLSMFINYLNHPLPFRPIPLTEEILLKCGFEHETMYIIKNLYLIEYGDFYFLLDENNGYYHVKLSNHSFGHEKQVGLGIIKHLHQLQNLYFALTNQELNVEL